MPERYVNPKREELNYQSDNKAIPSRKFSIKASATFKCKILSLEGDLPLMKENDWPLNLYDYEQTGVMQ